MQVPFYLKSMSICHPSLISHSTFLYGSPHRLIEWLLHGLLGLRIIVRRRVLAHVPCLLPIGPFALRSLNPRTLLPFVAAPVFDVSVTAHVLIHPTASISQLRCYILYRILFPLHYPNCHYSLLVYPFLSLHPLCRHSMRFTRYCRSIRSAKAKMFRCLNGRFEAPHTGRTDAREVWTRKARRRTGERFLGGISLMVEGMFVYRLCFACRDCKAFIIIASQEGIVLENNNKQLSIA